MLPGCGYQGGESLHGATACMYSFADEYGVRYGAAPLSCKAVSTRGQHCAGPFSVGAGVEAEEVG
jgi:hypothetical protein